MENKCGQVEFLKHNLIDRIDALAGYELHNLEVKDGKLVVVNKKETGYVLSPVFKTREFPKLTASWVSQTPNKSLVELEISVFVGEEQSKFFSYGKWALYGENLYYDQDDEKVFMSVDEVICKKGYVGNGFQYKVTLERDAELSLVCVALKLNDYSYPVDANFLPSTCIYDVPKLNQNMVPVIGHEMCSATTTAMLLKFKGMSFKEYDAEFEHRYVASLVADRGHNAPTFGNWVYNTIVMGAFGYTAYVARMYSWEELKLHLAKVGPVGASIKGDTGVYKTGGHLLVVVGYKEVDGKVYVVCNDPNINERFGEGLFVRYEFPLETFMNFWRGVAYVIE